MDDDAWAKGVRRVLLSWGIIESNDDGEDETALFAADLLAAAGAKIVPTVATEAMYDAIDAVNRTDWTPCDIWESAIGASPPLARGKPQEARDE